MRRLELAIQCHQGNLGGCKELITRYLVHVEQYYRKPDGTLTSEIEAIRSALRALGDLYADTKVRDFGPRALIAVRQRMIDLAWCRKSINKHVCHVRAMFPWATEHELIAGGVYHALTAVSGLKRGRIRAGGNRRPCPSSSTSNTWSVRVRNTLNKHNKTNSPLCFPQNHAT